MALTCLWPPRRPAPPCKLPPPLPTTGNTAEGSDSATLDYGTGTGAPAAPTVVISEDANNDGYINDTELDGDNITVTLGAGTAVGDTLIVTDQDGNELFNGTVIDSSRITAGLTVTPPATGTTLTVTATVTDPAGNTANGSDAATLDYGTGTGAPAAPTVRLPKMPTMMVTSTMASWTVRWTSPSPWALVPRWATPLWSPTRMATPCLKAT
ncbi:hypothetical protein [Grimontia sp. NTOU-MAR1]|uniref:hypothetical protein n=1 Tax=Grimontia sp. NTOU-MAR1 TaxID=3111011 RepID=UPI002DB927C8|nr:hypothetical protein [Grimontia sp. NTOU-MAR1]WRV96243.1 hypothetical protein VP504_00050 [Grimontia sp. NTOU-MAR1]